MKTTKTVNTLGTLTTGKREAISFGRFSSNKQEEGDSVNRQKHAYTSVLARYSERCEPSTRYTFGTFFGKGESGFHGKHLAEGGSLRRFLDLLKSGVIDPNKTVLVIEMWSRFSRMEPDLAVKLLSDIVRSGCVVAVYSPDMWVDTPNLEGQNFIIIAMCLQMAHAEAKEKSRIGKKNRENIRTTGLTIGKQKPRTCPTWISVSKDGKAYELNDKAETLRKACLLAAQGHGQTHIANTLNIQASGLTGYFRSRALIGEYQPQTRDNGRSNIGAPVADYYPSLLSADEFRQLQSSLDSRVKQKGMRSIKVTNLFTDLMFNEFGEVMRVKTDSRGTHTIKRYVNRCWGKGTGINYQLVEDAILDVFLSLTREQLYPADSSESEKELRNLEAKIADTTANIAQWEAEAVEGNRGLSRLISASTVKLEAYEAELETVKTRLVVNKVDNLSAGKTIITELLAEKTGKELIDLRSRLKAVINRVVRRIVITIHSPYSCSLEVNLVNGKAVSVGSVGKVKGLTVAVGIEGEDD